MNESPHLEKNRERARVFLRIPVEVRGMAEDGSPLHVEAHTGVVGTHGAMVRMSCRLQTGTLVELTNRFSQQTAKFRVVWAKEGTEYNVWEIGVESLKPLNDFWGVRFPSKV